MSKLLVTGATGFLGAWLVKRLVKDGYEVRILRRKSSDISELEGLSIEHFIGDVTDKDSVLNAAKNVNSIFHLAGVIGYQRKQRQLMEKVNVEGTYNVLEAMKNSNVERLVHLSSVVAIGASMDGKNILDESSPYNMSKFNLGYSETKKKGEDLVIDNVKTGKVNAVILNPSTIYGSGDFKKSSRGIQKKVAKGKFPFYTRGGVNVVAVEDVVEGILKAWKIGQNGERYILAGENITIKELFSKIAKYANQKPPFILLPDFVVGTLGILGDILESIDKKGPVNSEAAIMSKMYHWFKNEKAKKELGMEFKTSDYAIEKSIKWLINNEVG